MTDDIYQAIRQDDLAAVKHLLETGKDFESEGGWNPLHEACREGHLEMVTAILAHMEKSPYAFTGNVNTYFEIGDECEERGSALTEALLSGHKEVALFLIEHGANVNETYLNEERDSPEWLLGFQELVTDDGVAWWLADEELRNLCLESGLEIDAVDSHEKTLLAYAVPQCDVATVRWLLEHGANADFRFCADWDEIPLLHQAISLHAKNKTDDTLSIVSLLLKHGASLNVCDGEDKSVVDAVLEYENEALIDLFGLRQVLVLKKAYESTQKNGQ